MFEGLVLGERAFDRARDGRGRVEGPDNAHAGCVVVLIATCRSGEYAHEQMDVEAVK